MATQVATFEFESPLNIGGSWGNRPIADNAKSVMTMYKDDNPNYYFIEWEANIEAEEPEFETVGIYLDGNEVIDVDGIMDTPDQVVKMCELVGFKFSEDCMPDDYDANVPYTSFKKSL